MSTHKQDCVCTDKCQRRHPFPDDWPWRCRQLPPCTSLEQLLTSATLAFQRTEIDECKRCVLQYYGRRNKGEENPKTVRYGVSGDAVASALLTLINARMYPYVVNDPNRPEDCQHCGE